MARPARTTISGRASTSAARRVEVHDAGAQQVAASDDGVRDERLAAALQPIQQRPVQRVEIALAVSFSPTRARRSDGT